MSDISTPPMGVNKVDAWQTSWDVGTFESDEPRRISPAWSPSITPEAETQTEPGNDFSKKGEMWQYPCEACGQPLPSKKTTQDSEWDLSLYVWFRELSCIFIISEYVKSFVLYTNYRLDWSSLERSRCGTNPYSHRISLWKLLYL